MITTLRAAMQPPFDLLESRPAPGRVVAHQPVAPRSADGHEVPALADRVLARPFPFERQQMQAVPGAPAGRRLDRLARLADLAPGARVIPAEPQARPLHEMGEDHARPGVALSGGLPRLRFLARRQELDHRGSLLAQRVPAAL